MNFTKILSTVLLSSIAWNASAQLEVPSTYTFSRSGNTSVFHPGQSTRLNSFSEILVYMKTASNWPLSQAKLDEIYKGRKPKDLYSKTASSRAYYANNSSEQSQVRAHFEKILSDAILASKSGSTLASSGSAGYVTTKKYLVDANGLELAQLFEKGLMGACLLDQVLNNYTHSTKLDQGSNRENNDNSVLESGKNYTTMEHYWDEAFGYVYGQEGSFWSKYIDKVNSNPHFNTIKEDLNLAFRKGRAAIIAKDYVLREEQAKIIREKLSLIAAVRAVHYLEAGKSDLNKGPQAAFHHLSEAIEFIYILAFTQNPNTEKPYFSLTEVEAMIQDILSGNNGLWDTNKVTEKTSLYANKIANKFGFTVEQAK